MEFSCTTCLCIESDKVVIFFSEIDDYVHFQSLNSTFNLSIVAQVLYTLNCKYNWNTTVLWCRWFAKRFLHPDIVAEYNYIFLWDEDLGVEYFDPKRQVLFSFS